MSEYYDYITGQGVIVPDTSMVLAEVQEMFTNAFGLDLDLSATTPQGRLIEMFQRNRTFCIQICAAVSNMLNLNRATGFALDDLGSLFLLSRHPATRTTTTVILSGVPNTVIPAGTRLQNEDGNKFVSVEETTIEEDGTVSTIFEAEETGNIPCPANTLNIILDNIEGLESANNPSVPSLGHELESDSDFRYRIKNSLNVNSIAILSAIKSNLDAIDGVIDSYCYDNYTNTSEVIDSVVVPPHSLLVCVEGGEPNDIAQVIYEKKTIGTGYISVVLHGADGNDYRLVGKDEDNSVIVWEYNGVRYYTSGTSMPSISDDIYSDVDCTTTETTISSADNLDYTVITENVIDEAYGTVYPVTFIRPAEVPIDVEITVRKQGYSGSDLESAVKNAIIQWYNGDVEGVDGIKIGKAVSPFEISAAVSDVLPEVFITNVEVARHGQTPSASTISITEVHKATIDINNITVNIQ